MVKVKVRTLDIAPLRETPPLRRSGMAHVLNESQFTCFTVLLLWRRHNRNHTITIKKLVQSMQSKSF